MSLKAITWVMEHAPVESPTEMVILYALADRAHDDGSSAWPSYQWIADRAVCSRRTVIRHIKAMEERGLITRGDQRFVQHLPSDKRPTVWNLNLSLRRPIKPNAGCQSVTPDGSGVSPEVSAGCHPVHSGVSSRAERGVTLVTQSVLEPKEEPSKNPPVVPQGGQAPKPKKGHRLPEGWMPDPDVIDAMRQENPGVDLQREHAKFSDHWAAASGANASKRDWNAAWRNWIRRAADSYPARQQTRPQTREEKLRAWGAPSQVHVPQDSPKELTW